MGAGSLMDDHIDNMILDHERMFAESQARFHDLADKLRAVRLEMDRRRRIIDRLYEQKLRAADERRHGTERYG